MSARIGVEITSDGRKFTAGVDGAKRKVDELDGKVKKFGFTMESIKKTFGFGMALQGVEMLINSMDKVVEWSESGIKIVSDSDVRNMKSIVGMMDETKVVITTFFAQIGKFTLGGLKEFFAFAGARFGGAGGAEAHSIAKQQLEDTKTIDEIKKIAELKKEIAKEEKKATEEYEDFLAEVEINQMQKESDALKKSREEEKKAAEELFDLQIKLLGELKKEKDKELADRVKAEKDFRKRTRDEAETREEARQQIEELYSGKDKEAKFKALAGAEKGMYLGGTDRSMLGVKAHQEKLAEDANKILKDMDKKLARIAEDY